MGKKINNMLRRAAAMGINMSPVQAHQAVHRRAPAPAPAPAPKPAASNKVTLKPLVNKKGKVVGMGHFKGNETQDRSAIPKKAPTSKAGKAALTDAIAKTGTPIAKSALKKQKEVIPPKQLNPVKKKAVQTSAAASGVDPSVVKSLGTVKKVGNVMKKGKAASAVAQAGGDVNAQMLAAQGGKKNQPVKTAKKIITDAQKSAPAPAPKKVNPPQRPPQTLYDRRPRQLDDGENLKVKKKSKRKRRALSRGTGQLRIAPSGQSTNVSGTGGSGVNV